jgi:hypothetical protein
MTSKVNRPVCFVCDRQIPIQEPKEMRFTEEGKRVCSETCRWAWTESSRLMGQQKQEIEQTTLDELCEQFDIIGKLLGLEGRFLVEFGYSQIQDAVKKRVATVEEELLDDGPQSDVANIINMLAEVFQQKNVEYKGSHPDVFRNFTLGSRLQDESPEQTLLGYVNKQIVSLFDAKHVNPERLKDIGFVEEKAKDIAIYMIILIAMVRKNHAI